MHLRVALERLNRRFGIKAETKKRDIGYKETIRKSIEIRGGTKSRAAATGSSATWCWRSSRSNAATAWPSPK